jgi:hypothetical protein
MPNEIIICVALCMFFEGELVEHTYQKSMAECLKNKRQAERSIQPERVQFACGKDVKAEVEYIEEKGETVARVRIIKVIKSGYEEGLYEGSSRY